MSASTAQLLAYRCTKCWQLTCAGSDQVGTAVECVCCSTPMLVPEATEKTIQAGEEFAANSDANPQTRINFTEQMSSDQIRKIAEENVRQDVRENGSLEARSCSRIKRLLGSIIDSVASFMAIITGIILAGLVQSMMGESAGVFPFIVMVSIPLLLGVYQCYGIAVDGQSIGKYCVKSKIVGLDGKPPGFFQGVIMRIGVVAFLGLIPFFGMVDVCWIYYEPKRCLHDYIAGTFVIDE